ncbi:MAG: histidine kinase [Chloroflexi bacterium]|nr:histidine kinase [Chloroflexota bacterium]
MNVDHLDIIEQKIEDLKARLPAHSIPPKMIQDLEELEEELAEAKAQQWAT